MAVELQVLAWAGLLAAIQLALMAVPANLQLGSRYTLGPRDAPRLLYGVAGRLNRAYQNHMEGLALFTLAVVVVVLGQAANDATAFCAWTYLVARVAYVPAYASGVPLVRTLIWFVGFVATLAMLVIALI